MDLYSGSVLNIDCFDKREQNDITFELSVPWIEDTYTINVYPDQYNTKTAIFSKALEVEGNLLRADIPPGSIPESKNEGYYEIFMADQKKVIIKGIIKYV